NDDAHTQRGEHASVFDADHAAANNNESPGDLRHAQDLIAIDDVPAVDGYLGVRSRLSASGNHYVLPLKFAVAIVVFDANAVRAHELCGSMDQVDAIALKLILSNTNLVFHDVLDPEV